MSQSSNSRNPHVYAETKDGSELPKINDKRFSDVIDYSQPRPRTANDNKYGSTGVSDNQMNAAPEDTEGYPVQLVTADPKTGRFTLNEEFAAELITTYEGNISFVTVGGKVNTGKSFLLNNLLNLKGEGFPIDHSDNTCTDGIWIWSKPVYSEKDGLYIFFLDTEGSHSVKKTASHDAKIFALTLLLSSYYIYNSFGSIDENSINDLSLTTKLPKNVVLSAEESIEPVLSFYTPKFLWALRDFSLEIQDSQGRFISTNQYMESALNDQNPHVKTSETNKKIRQAVINCFNDRECVAFVRPIYDGREFGRLTQIQNAPIRPDFVKQVNALREKVLNKITPKELKGVPLNMRMYMAMLNNYIETLNQGGVPNVSEAYEYMIENECREAFEQAVDLYELAMKKFFFSEERAKPIEELYNILKNIRDSAFDKYVKITSPLEKNELTHQFKGELKDYIDKKEQQVVAINEEFHQTNNEELLEQLAQPIKEKLESNGYGPKNIQEFHDAFNNFLETYDVEGQGLSKTTGLIQFVMNFQPEIVTALTLSLNEKAEVVTKSSTEDKAKLNENQQALKKDLEVVEGHLKEVEEEVAKAKAERDEVARKNARINNEIQKINNQGEKDLEDEKKRTKLEMNKLKDVDKEFEELTKQNKEYLEEIKKRKTACCNMF